MNRLEKIHCQLKQFPPDNHIINFDNLCRVAQSHQIRKFKVGPDPRLTLRYQKLLRPDLRMRIVISKRFFELLVKSQNMTNIVQRLLNQLLRRGDLSPRELGHIFWPFLLLCHWTLGRRLWSMGWNCLRSQLGRLGRWSRKRLRCRYLGSLRGSWVSYSSGRFPIIYIRGQSSEFSESSK